MATIVDMVIFNVAVDIVVVVDVVVDIAVAVTTIVVPAMAMEATEMSPVSLLCFCSSW